MSGVITISEPGLIAAFLGVAMSVTSALLVKLHTDEIEMTAFEVLASIGAYLWAAWLLYTLVSEVAA